jgi:aspartate aminotransferase
MSIDVAPLFQGCEDLAARTPNELARGLMGSSILAIAGEVNALKAKGASVANFTVGDFSPDHFRIPPAFRDGIIAQLDQGKTNYPPAVGVPELHKAIRALYKRELGLDYPDGTVQIGSGARPPLYGLFATVLGPGDVLVYPVPSWNNNYYAYLNQAKGIAVDTKPENGFLPTVEDLAPYLPIAQVISLNSPLNPTGTAFTEPQLRAICEAILAENKRRAAIGDRPLILLYDQCYWQLTFGDTKHFTPVGLIPEMARYTVFVDAISKCWAATGVRLGWSVSPPWIRNRMQPLIGHIGAWAPCAEQHAAAKLLEDPAILADWKPVFTTRSRAASCACGTGSAR